MKQTCDNCGKNGCTYPESITSCEWEQKTLLTEYQKDVLRTKNNELSHIDQLTNAAIGAAGESGELSELVKKHRYQGHDFNREKYIDETGDALFYLTLGLLEIGSSLEEAICCNVKKRENIYPDGFDAERSRGRKRE